MKIHLSKYQLQKKNLVNAMDISSTHEGTLIKVTDEQNNWGVADLCPWPNLGDLELDQELKTKGSLFQRTLKLAKDDLEARKNRVSLLSDKAVENNWLVTNLTEYPKSGTVKVKGSADVDRLSYYLKKLAQEDIKIRLDFNSCLTASDYNYFLNQLTLDVARKIEYIEDPTVWNFDNWQMWNQLLPLAVDFANENPFKYPTAWSYLIIKPTRQEAKTLVQMCRSLNKKFSLTSAMDHPVGLAHGLRFAQKYSENINGFLTLDLYQPTEFNSYFKIEENRMSFSESALDSFGIGMADVLNRLDWVRYESL
ncbi:MAG: hypothetical protein WA160_00960 [Pseudobdellovibrio sp.]